MGDVVQVDEDIADLLPGFARNRLAEVEGLRRHLEAGALEEARRIAHRLKGVGGGYGFPRLSELGTELEGAAGRGELAPAMAALAELETYLRDVRVRLDGEERSLSALAEG